MNRRKLEESYPAYYRHEVYLYLDTMSDPKGSLSKLDREIKNAVRALGGETDLPNEVEIEESAFKRYRYELFFYLDSRSNFEVHHTELKAAIETALENTGLTNYNINLAEIIMIENLNANLNENRLWENNDALDLKTRESLNNIDYLLTHFLVGKRLTVKELGEQAADKLSSILGKVIPELSFEETYREEEDTWDESLIAAIETDRDEEGSIEELIIEIYFIRTREEDTLYITEISTDFY